MAEAGSEGDQPICDWCKEQLEAPPALEMSDGRRLCFTCSLVITSMLSRQPCCFCGAGDTVIHIRAHSICFGCCDEAAAIAASHGRHHLPKLHAVLGEGGDGGGA